MNHPGCVFFAVYIRYLGEHCSRLFYSESSIKMIFFSSRCFSDIPIKWILIGFFEEETNILFLITFQASSISEVHRLKGMITNRYISKFPEAGKSN